MHEIAYSFIPGIPFQGEGDDMGQGRGRGVGGEGAKGWGGKGDRRGEGR
jgi:hypothetical protein